MGRDISVTIGAHRFNYRVAAIIRREDAFLVCRSERDGFCYLPGGRVQDGESASDALVRELREELGFDVKVERAVFFTENFFSLHGEKGCMSFVCIYEVALPITGSFPQIADNNDELLWLDVAALKAANLQPGFLVGRLENLPPTLEQLVLYDS